MPNKRKNRYHKKTKKSEYHSNKMNQSVEEIHEEISDRSPSPSDCNILSVKDNSLTKSSNVHPHIKLSWPSILHETIHNYSVSIPLAIQGLKHVCGSQDTSEYSNDFNSMCHEIKLQFEILKTSADYMLQEFCKIAEERTKLNKIITFQEKACQTDSNLIKDNKCSQTQIGFKDCTTKFSLSQPEIYNTVLNPSNAYNFKPIRIIMYRLPENISLPDILDAVMHLTKNDNPFISFVKKYKQKSNCTFNWIVDCEREIANELIRDKIIKIRTQSYAIERYIFVNRCYVCQSFNHEAKSCPNQTICAVCGSFHYSINCQNQPNCINCIKSNRSCDTHFNIMHEAYSNKCPSLKLYISQTRHILNMSC